MADDITQIGQLIVQLHQPTKMFSVRVSVVFTNLSSLLSVLLIESSWDSHHLGMNYYVNFFGGIGSNGFHII